jgi:hypothetical protein
MAAIKNVHHRRHADNRPTVSPAGGIMAPDPLRNQAIPVPLGIEVAASQNFAAIPSIEAMEPSSSASIVFPEIECTQVSPWMRVERNAPSAMCRIAPELRECSGDK